MESGELLDSDHAIIAALEDGRATPAALVDWTNLSKQTIHNRLNVLTAAGHVEKIHTSGLYELKDDPRN